jgi:hypothetical protein
MTGNAKAGAIHRVGFLRFPLFGSLAFGPCELITQ